MMRLKNREIGPPDSFRYTHPETGHVSRGVNWWAWESAILAHRKSNQLPIPSNMMEIAEDQLCRQLDPSHCEYSERDGPFVNTRLTIRDIYEGAKAYTKLFGKKLLGMDETVSQAEADRRAKICARCFLRIRPEGCGACSQLAEIVTGNVARLKSAYDPDLEGRACAVCGCPAKPLVHFPMALLEEHDTPEKQALYPKEFCWRQKQSPNYLPNEELLATA